MNKLLSSVRAELERLRPVVEEAGFKLYESDGNCVFEVRGPDGRAIDYIVYIYDPNTMSKYGFSLTVRIEKDLLEAIQSLRDAVKVA